MQIYMIRNKINDKKYIGQTIRTFQERYHNRWWNNMHNVHLNHSVKKYGIENFEVIILVDGVCTIEELNKLESEFILAYNTTDQNFGYNMNGGGDNKYMSEEQKLKIGQANEGNIPWNKGDITPKEVKIKMSKTHLENPSFGMLDKNHTKETKIKMSKSSIGNKSRKGMINSLEMKHKQMNQPHKKQVIDNNGVVYNSITEVSNIYKVARKTIRNWIESGKMSYLEADV